MSEKVLIKGNYAIAQAALNAGLECYFGYPITPQTEIGEYLSGEMYKRNLAYVCAESELAAINMVLGASSTGAKTMTTSSSCAVALMQEALSYACADEVPVVLVRSRPELTAMICLAVLKLLARPIQESLFDEKPNK